MREGLRSLNVAMAAAMAVGEAKRQLEASSLAASAVVPKSAADASKRRGG
jgi:hypothetical protein